MRGYPLYLNYFSQAAINIGGDVFGRDFYARSANPTHGSAYLGISNLWGGGATQFPFIGSTGDNLIMLAKPHLPFLAGYGAFVRMATAPSAPSWWDMGVYEGDRWVITREGALKLEIFPDRIIHHQKVYGNTTYMRDTALYFRGDGDNAHGIVYHPTGWGGSGREGISIHGYAGGTLGTYVNGAWTALWNSDGDFVARRNLIAGNMLHVNTNNLTGGGIVLADDGDIVDLNDGYCSMRFSYGVRVFSGNRQGTAVFTFGADGNATNRHGHRLAPIVTHTAAPTTEPAQDGTVWVVY